jgi:flavodoxin
MLLNNRMDRRNALLGPLLSVLGAGVVWGARPVNAQEQRGNRRLVAYLSRSGNTRVVAGQLGRRFRTDLFEIRTATPWPEDYEEMVAWASRLRDARATPALDNAADISRYETVFLGFPIWGTALPAPVRTFLTTHDLSGKKVVPFIAHGGYGPGSAPATLAELAPRARFARAFVLQGDQERDTLNRVTAWLRDVEPEL